MLLSSVVLRTSNDKIRSSLGSQPATPYVGTCASFISTSKWRLHFGANFSDANFFVSVHFYSETIFSQSGFIHTIKEEMIGWLASKLCLGLNSLKVQDRIWNRLMSSRSSLCLEKMRVYIKDTTGDGVRVDKEEAEGSLWDSLY